MITNHPSVVLGSLAVVIAARPVDAQMDTTKTPPPLAVARTLVDSSTLARGTHSPTLTELLGGKSPSLTVYRPNGALGLGGTLRSRGVNRFVEDADPILVIDGQVVPTSGLAWSVPFSGLGVVLGGESRVDLLDPDDVVSIEIVPGYAASLEGGPGAVAGVVRITTKRGQAISPPPSCPATTRWATLCAPA